MNTIQTNSWNKAILILILAAAFFTLVSFDILAAYQFVSAILTVICGGTFFVLSLINIADQKWPNLYQYIIIASLLIGITLTYLNRNGYFYGRKIVDATFLDDMSRMDMYLYEDEHYIITSSWILGSETFIGTYKITGNTITFDKQPVAASDFIDKSITISGDKIYFRRNTPDTSFYSFKINK